MSKNIFGVPMDAQVMQLNDMRIRFVMQKQDIFLMETQFTFSRKHFPTWRFIYISIMLDKEW